MRTLGKELLPARLGCFQVSIAPRAESDDGHDMSDMKSRRVTFKTLGASKPQVEDMGGLPQTVP